MKITNTSISIIIQIMNFEFIDNIESSSVHRFSDIKYSQINNNHIKIQKRRHKNNIQKYLLNHDYNKCMQIIENNEYLSDDELCQICRYGCNRLVVKLASIKTDFNRFFLQFISLAVVSDCIRTNIFHQNLIYLQQYHSDIMDNCITMLENGAIVTREVIEKVKSINPTSIYNKILIKYTDHKLHYLYEFRENISYS